MPAPTLHPDLTFDRIAAACERYWRSTDNPGFCTACGCEVDGVEPDAREYECEACGEPSVWGAEELLFEAA